MLRNSSDITGYSIGATDGPIGHVSDFLFDDATWRVRWLVVSTGWLTGHKVLVPPSVLNHFSPIGHQFAARLTIQQVKDSPGIDADKPVSREMEGHLYDYYGWSPYWNSDVFLGGYGNIHAMSEEAAIQARPRDEATPYGRRYRAQSHLRSIAAVTGYHIHATDGEIGHVDDFLVEDEDWSIHYLIVDTKNWWPGKRVLISPRSARMIDWADRQVDLNVSREIVKASPEYDPLSLPDRSFQTRYTAYYRGLGA